MDKFNNKLIIKMLLLIILVSLILVNDNLVFAETSEENEDISFNSDSNTIILETDKNKWYTIRVYSTADGVITNYLINQGNTGKEGIIKEKLENLNNTREVSAVIQINVDGNHYPDKHITINKSKDTQTGEDQEDKYKNELRLIIDTGERRDSIDYKVGFNKDETVRTVTERAVDEIKKDDKDLRFTFTRDGNLTGYETRRETYKNDTKTGYKWILTIDGKEPRDNPRIERLDTRTRDITWIYEKIKDDKKDDDKKDDDKKDKEAEKDGTKEKPGIDEDGNPTGNLFDKTSKTPYITGYKDQTFRPQRNAKREEVAAMVYKIIDKAVISENKSDIIRFVDVPDYKWSLEYITTLSNMNLINGYKDRTFRPEKSITRAETVAIVARATNVEEKSGSVFGDTSGHWAEGLINGVADKGWLNGYQDGTFRPNEPITRAELVTVLNNALERPKKVGSSNRFNDVSSFNWYYDEVMKAASF